MCGYSTAWHLADQSTSKNNLLFSEQMFNKTKLSIPNDTYFTIVADKVDSVSGIYCGATEVTLFEPHGEKCVKSFEKREKAEVAC